MSVPKSKRSIPKCEYVKIALELTVKIESVYGRFPKSWSFTHTQFVLKAVNELLQHVYTANYGIYVKTNKDAENAIYHLQQAVGICYYLQSRFDQLMLKPPFRLKAYADKDGNNKTQKKILFTDKTAEQLSSICGKEIKLLQGTIKYYQERQVNTF